MGLVNEHKVWAVSSVVCIKLKDTNFSDVG